MEQQINADRRGFKNFGNIEKLLKFIVSLSVSICVIPLLLLISSCSSKPTDLRTLVPADSLVYLETNDLAAALQPIVENKAFEQVAKSKPDFSALKGVQLAIAVTGFEITEEKLTDEHSVGRIQPHFVAVAETHAWNYQAVGFAEKKLGAFVANIYDSEPTLEKSDKNGGKYFAWTAKDGRKAFALVIDSLIYFANDETAIDKCLAVKRGEADSIVKTAKVPPSDLKTLATGYVSPDGIAQIANIVGLKFASEAGEDSEVQSAIAGILPQLLRSSVTEISWMATRTEQGIEDKYWVSMPQDLANVFHETFAIGDTSNTNSTVNNMLVAQLPPNTQRATRYNLKTPQLAWRSILLVVQMQMDPLGGTIISEFGALLLEPYGIRDPELFLSSLGGKYQTSRNILTARLNSEADETVVVAGRGDDQSTLKSLSPDLIRPETIIEGGLNVWSTADNDIQMAFDGDCIKIGSKENLVMVNGVRFGEMEDIRSDALRKLATSTAPITTVEQDNDSVTRIVDVLSERKSEGARSVQNYITETRFTKTGIERRTVSDFGLIGSIIAQLNPE